MIIIPPFFYLFDDDSNVSPPIFDPKLFLKVFAITSISLSLLATNIYTGYETSHRIKDMPTIERKVGEAKRLKNDIKKEWYFSPFLLGEYFTANHYLKKNQ